MYFDRKRKAYKTFSHLPFTIYSQTYIYEKKKEIKLEQKFLDNLVRSKTLFLLIYIFSNFNNEYIPNYYRIQTENFRLNQKNDLGE